VKRYSRRQMMILGTGVGASVIGLMLSAPALGFLLSPLFIQRRTVWVTVGPIDRVPVGTPTPLVAHIPAEQGWPVPSEPRIVYVVKKADGKLHTFANICTHMQCDVHWQPSLNQFVCPCHGGLYDIDGQNVGGPPPQPLPQWIHRVRFDPVQQQHILEIQNTLDEGI
jgi:menaquinol-cytochrome c reductase iron-sulfur subunit